MEQTYASIDLKKTIIRYPGEKKRSQSQFFDEFALLWIITVDKRFKQECSRCPQRKFTLSYFVLLLGGLSWQSHLNNPQRFYFRNLQLMHLDTLPMSAF